MNCAYPHCRGLTSSLVCSDHGEICEDCGIPTSHHREDKLCPRCGARADGIKCADCGSPWVYITYYLDGNWRCRNRSSRIIHENGWDQTPEEVAAMLKELNDKRSAAKKEQEEKIEAQRAIQEKMKKTRKPKQSEALWEEG